MATPTLSPNYPTVNNARFVAPTAEAQARFERDLGRNLYRRGRGLSDCSTDDMAAGWLAAERQGADDYCRAMMAEAN